MALLPTPQAPVGESGPSHPQTRLSWPDQMCMESEWASTEILCQNCGQTYYLTCQPGPPPSDLLEQAGAPARLRLDEIIVTPILIFFSFIYF